MTAGNIGAWQKKVGDTIAPGDVLVEIETDKAQMDFEFQEEGVLAKILKDAGEKDVPVGNVRDFFALPHSVLRNADVTVLANCCSRRRGNRCICLRVLQSRRRRR